MKKLTFKIDGDRKKEMFLLSTLYDMWIEFTVPYLHFYHMVELKAVKNSKISNNEKYDYKKIKKHNDYTRIEGRYDYEIIKKLNHNITLHKKLDIEDIEIPDIIFDIYCILFPEEKCYENGKYIKKKIFPKIPIIKNSELNDFKYKYQTIVYKPSRSLSSIKTVLKILNQIFATYVTYDIEGNLIGEDNKKLFLNKKRLKNNVILTICTNDDVVNYIIDQNPSLLTLILEF